MIQWLARESKFPVPNIDNFLFSVSWVSYAGLRDLFSDIVKRSDSEVFRSFPKFATSKDVVSAMKPVEFMRDNPSAEEIVINYAGQGMLGIAFSVMATDICNDGNLIVDVVKMAKMSGLPVYTMENNLAEDICPFEQALSVAEVRSLSEHDLVASLWTKYSDNYEVRPVRGESQLEFHIRLPTVTIARYLKDVINQQSPKLPSSVEVNGGVVLKIPVKAECDFSIVFPYLKPSQLSAFQRCVSQRVR